jgi:hypothetical protein
VWTKFAKMSVRDAMISIAGKPGYGEQPRWLEKVADAANISKRAARSLWRGEIQSDNHRAARAVKEAAYRRQLELARRDARSLANQYQSIADALNAKDPDFHREDIAALISAARALSNVDRTGD